MKIDCADASHDMIDAALEDAVPLTASEDSAPRDDVPPPGDRDVPPEAATSGGGASSPPRKHVHNRTRQRDEAAKPFPVILLTEPPTPTRWLIGGLLPAGSCALMAAAPKCGKTWLTLAIALALAMERSVLGRWQAKRKGKTLFYSPESNRNALTCRLWGLCWGMGLDPRAVAADLPFIDARLDLAAADHVARLAATVEQHDPCLVVIDPLVSAAAGIDENASGDIMKVLNPLRDLTADRQDLSVLLVHHTSKAAGDRSRALGIRGSSAIDAWRDTLITLLLAKDDDSDPPRRVDVDHRDAPAPAPAGFQLASGPATDEGHPELSWFRLDPCDPPEVKKHSGGPSASTQAKKLAKGAMVAAARKEPGSYRAAALAKAAGIKVSDRSARDYVIELTKERQLHRDKDGWIHPEPQGKDR